MSAGIWVHSYSVTPPRRGQIFGNSRWLSSESDVMAHDHDVMVEAVNHIWLLFNIHPCQTYIVLCHLLMMSVCILWVHPYTVTPINLDQSLQFWGHCQVEMMPQCHGWGWRPPLIASHIHIGYSTTPNNEFSVLLKWLLNCVPSIFSRCCQQTFSAPRHFPPK
jgi:hypothetical protein